MDKPRVFISYSRQQFYFAESLAKKLKFYDIPVWIDVQQLEAGLDWSEGIHKGLQDGSALILIASRDAVDSPYVQNEWATALNAGKSVHIVFFEAVKLPSALAAGRQVSHYDFRRNFDYKVGVLSDCLKTGKTRHESISAFPLVLPMAQWIVLTSFFIPSLILSIWLWAALSRFHLPDHLDLYELRRASASILIIVNGIFLAAVGFTCAVLFLRRRFDAYTLMSITVIPTTGLWFTFRLLEKGNHGTLLFMMGEDVPFFWDEFVLIEFFLMALAIASVWLQRTSADILRWMPVGEAPLRMRQAVYARDAKSRAASTSLPRPGRTYRIYAEPGDASVAQDVESFLQRAGYQYADAPVTRILILSNLTSRDWLASTLDEAPGHKFAVIATSVQIPERREELFRFQWVDYRLRTPEQLEQLLTEDPPLALATVPEDMQRIVMPRGIYFATNGMRTLGVLAGAIGLYFLVLLALRNLEFWQKAQVPVHLSEFGSWFGLPVVMLGIAAFWLAERMIMRQVRSENVMTTLATFWFSVIALYVGLVLWVASRLYGPVPYKGNPTIYEWLCFAMFIVIATALFVTLHWGAEIKRWLPSHPAKHKPGNTLQAPVPRGTLVLYGSVTLLCVLQLLLSTP